MGINQKRVANGEGHGHAKRQRKEEEMSYPTAEDVAASLPHFDDAVKYINGLPKESPVPGVELTSQEEKLGYYALFKVGTVGKVTSKRPRPCTSTLLPSRCSSTPRRGRRFSLVEARGGL